MKHDRYQEALRFIYDRQHFGIKLGLHNIIRLSEWLGNPERKYPTIHIAGTNGKGSTSSFIAGILRASGYKVGLLTSPHLADYRERIRVNGQKIRPEAITEFIEEYKPLILRSRVTFFEVTTALAFWYFAKCKVDWAVVETGLGGRLDATNIITPEVSVITNIALEHTNLLGYSIYKIAGEKAGIIKPGVPLVTGVVNNGNDAAKRFREIGRERKAPVHFHRPADFDRMRRNGSDLLHLKKGPFAGLKAPVSLPGGHQVENGFLAVRTVEILRKKGYPITRAAVKEGLSTSYWPGRFMTLRRNPTVIIDVAHNKDGFRALAETLKRNYPDKKFDFLIGMVEKKKGHECLEIIAPLARSISITPLTTERSDDPYWLISRLKAGKNQIRLFPDPVSAYKDLLENSSRSDILIIAGSHFIVGDLASYIKREGF
jgi:dihydrofolate synthase/folylpolyglutamate synthase